MSIAFDPRGHGTRYSSSYGYSLHVISVLDLRSVQFLFAASKVITFICDFPHPAGHHIPPSPPTVDVSTHVVPSNTAHCS